MHARPGPRADFRADHGSGPLRATTALTAVLFALTALLTFARVPNPSATKATDPLAPKG